MVYRTKLMRWRIHQALHQEVLLDTQHGRLYVSTRDQIIGRTLFFVGHFQVDMIRNAVASLRNSGQLPERGTGVMVDIGANNGLYSIGMLCDGEFATAVGVEADAYNYSLLTRNVRENGLEAIYDAIQAAATDSSGHVSLMLSADNLGDHRVVRTGLEASGSLQLVRANRIDTLLREGGTDPTTVAMVLLDVQGHECDVLRGGTELFARGTPTILELWPRGIEAAGRTKAEFCDIVSRYWEHFWLPFMTQTSRPISELPAMWDQLAATDEQADIVLSRSRS